MPNTKKIATTKIVAMVMAIIFLGSIFTVFPTMQVSAAPSGNGTYIVTATSGLNVRSGPSTSYSKINGIPYGKTFTVTKTSNEWGYVPSHNGWVSLHYAKILSSSNSTNANISTGSNRGAEWALSQIGKSIDYDGVYGVQCVDLIKAYYSYLGVNAVKGNGCDYITNALPSGWQRIKNTPDFIPQPGDIAVWTSAVGGGYGHVGIVISGGLREFVSVDQNWGGKSARKVTHNYSGFWGVIRPKF